MDGNERPPYIASHVASPCTARRRSAANCSFMRELEAYDAWYSAVLGPGCYWAEPPLQGSSACDDLLTAASPDPLIAAGQYDSAPLRSCDGPLRSARVPRCPGREQGRTCKRDCAPAPGAHRCGRPALRYRVLLWCSRLCLNCDDCFVGSAR